MEVKSKEELVKELELINRIGDVWISCYPEKMTQENFAEINKKKQELMDKLYKTAHKIGNQLYNLIEKEFENE